MTLPVRASSPGPQEGQLDECVQKLLHLLDRRIRHGHGELTVEIRTGAGNRREVLLKSGDWYKYLISLEEVHRRIDSRHGSD